jgi:hypothetical protein
MKKKKKKRREAHRINWGQLGNNEFLVSQVNKILTPPQHLSSIEHIYDQTSRLNINHHFRVVSLLRFDTMVIKYVVCTLGGLVIETMIR